MKEDILSALFTIRWMFALVLAFQGLLAVITGGDELRIAIVLLFALFIRP